MTLISIITPAYRAEATITRAVKSVLAQTHADWEMIIISDDNNDYRSILNKESVMDPRLRFADTGQVRSGPSRGRNIGLDMAKGEYITTLDADDEYHPVYLAQLLEAAKIYGVAMVRLSHKRMANGETQGLDYFSIKPEGYCRLSDLEDYLTNNACSVTMFNRRFLKYRYPKALHYGEDFYFDVQFFGDIDVIPVFYEELYIYHHHETSLTAHKRADQSFIDNYKVMIELTEADEKLPSRLKNSVLATCHHRLFRNYTYINAKARGECTDFFEFMAQHPEYFT